MIICNQKLLQQEPIVFEKCFEIPVVCYDPCFKETFFRGKFFGFVFCLCIVFCAFVYVRMHVCVFLWVYRYFCSISFIETFSDCLFELVKGFLVDQFLMTRAIFRRFGSPNDGCTILNDLFLSIIISFVIEMM